jgi:NTE family protein
MKTALVLSGGGMFGAYQAGAWKALSRQFSPDIVVGASVGALNGWYIASGATAEELERQWLDPSAGDILTLRQRRSRWRGLIDPRPLEARVKLLVQERRPRVEYGVVLTQVPRMRPKLFRNAEVTWRHLFATCAVPGGFPPVRVGDGLYWDGGLLEATPVWAAAAMGASRIIAVNASRFIPPRLVGIAIRGVRRWGNRAPSVSGNAPEATLVTPQVPLGSMLDDGAVWRRENIRRWIDLGEADAIAALR